jgi:hypothetical protein
MNIIKHIFVTDWVSKSTLETNIKCEYGCKEEVDQFGNHVLKCVKSKDSFHARHNEMVNEIYDLSNRLCFGVTKELKENYVDTKERPADLSFVCGKGGEKQNTDFTLTSSLCKSNIGKLIADKNTLTVKFEVSNRKKSKLGVREIATFAMHTLGGYVKKAIETVKLLAKALTNRTIMDRRKSFTFVRYQISAALVRNVGKNWLSINMNDYLVSLKLEFYR